MINYIRTENLVEEYKVDKEEYFSALDTDETLYLEENASLLSEAIGGSEFKFNKVNTKYVINNGRYALELLRFVNSKSKCNELKTLLQTSISDSNELIKYISKNGTNMPAMTVHTIGGYFSFVIASLLNTLEGVEVKIAIKRGIKGATLKGKDCDFMKTKEGKALYSGIMSMHKLLYDKAPTNPQTKFPQTKLNESVALTVGSVLFGLTSAAIKGALVSIGAFTVAITDIISSPITWTVAVIFAIRFAYIHIAASLYWRIKDILNTSPEVKVNLARVLNSYKKVSKTADTMSRNKLQAVTRTINKEKRSAVIPNSINGSSSSLI